MKVVFLDYDGVVNRKMWRIVDGKWQLGFGYPEDGCVNDAQAVQWVSEFCEKYGYDIVVTSTWRKYPEWEECLRNAGLRNSIKILGATSLPTKNRADEISEYLSANSDIEEYLVFDDDRTLMYDKNNRGGDMLIDTVGVHANNLVLCDTDRGFGENDYKRAVTAHLGLRYKRGDNIASIYSGDGNMKKLLDAVVEVLYSIGELSTSFLQRTFNIGYGRATAVITLLEEKKIVTIVRKNGNIKYMPNVEYDMAVGIIAEMTPEDFLAEV